VSVDSGAASGLNVETLRAVKEKFDLADVDEEIQRYFAISAKQLRQLLAQEEVTSSDYATIKALVEGKVDQFMGFTFVRTERLLYQTGGLQFDVSDGSVGSGAGDADGYRQCFAWAQEGLLRSVGEDVMARVTERADKSYSTQVYAEQDVGATRMEEEKVVEVLCTEA
jgi:hypothetical protein